MQRPFLSSLHWTVCESMSPCTHGLEMAALVAFLWVASEGDTSKKAAAFLPPCNAATVNKYTKIELSFKNEIFYKLLHLRCQHTHTNLRLQKKFTIMQCKYLLISDAVKKLMYWNHLQTLTVSKYQLKFNKFITYYYNCTAHIQTQKYQYPSLKTLCLELKEYNFRTIQIHTHFNIIEVNTQP